MQEVITGLQNPLVKRVKRLSEKSAARREENIFVAEGIRECSLMQQAGYAIETILLCQDLYKQQHPYPIDFGNNTRLVSKEVYESIAYRGSTEGIIALAQPANHTLASLKLSARPLLLVLDGIEKPGNIGAMLRTCDAVGVDAIVVCNTKADIYNPNVIRSSIGTVFTKQIAVCEWHEAFEYFKQHNIQSFAAKLGAEKFHYNCNFNQACAIVMGTEATGIETNIADACNEHLMIPMNGTIDSLNVSVSAAILLYEAVRQRAMET